MTAKDATLCSMLYALRSLKYYALSGLVVLPYSPVKGLHPLLYYFAPLGLGGIAGLSLNRAHKQAKC